MAARNWKLEKLLRRRQGGLLSLQINQFAEYLMENGYALATVDHYLRIADYFEKWLESQGISVACVERTHFRSFHETFVQPRTQRPITESQWHNVQAVGNHLLRILQKSRRKKSPLPDRFQKSLQEFSGYLHETRGLQDTTIRATCRYLDPFLRSHLSGKTFRPEWIPPKGIHDYVIAYAKTHGPDCTAQCISALRSYYRYLLCRGRRTERQLASIPDIPAWRTTAPPKVLSKSQRERFLQTFDRSTPIGKRDYAMAVWMLTLGLRAKDVTMLDLEHIDWRQAVLTVPNSKRRHPYVLPLTNVVGEALSDYIRDGRPSVASPRVFLRHMPPRGPLSTSGVSWPMQCAFSRAAITGVCGTHILRRSIASQIHASGGTVKEIADFLGHTSLESAGVYARTDEKLLRAFALPWPEETR